ncbi:MAG: hypothetical protein JWP63_6798 [Candidatus Solibacter sp.]|nr:hypothetical protein [Candidatus Solibacter sp.]
MDGGYQVRMRNAPGRLDYSSVSLKAIIERAWEVRDFQISGPEWMASTRFDVVAKLPADTPRSKIPEMLRTLLAERFQMTAHRETRELPVYALVAGKNGPKMKMVEADSTASPSGWVINQGPGRMQGLAMNMASVANMLSARLGRLVVDQTGLKGNYDFDLEYVPDGGPPDADGVTLFSAVQSQLGLKLEAGKGPVELIVVDHVEKIPTEN